MSGRTMKLQQRFIKLQIVQVCDVLSCKLAKPEEYGLYLFSETGTRSSIGYRSSSFHFSRRIPSQS